MVSPRRVNGKCGVAVILQEEMRIIRSKRRKFNLILCALTTSLVFMISGMILIFCRTLLYNKSKAEMQNLTPGKKTFEIFKKTPFDMYFDVYFFNWTNPEEFYDLTKKPRVKEVGPFRFLEVVEKTNITFHENSTVSYNRTRRWYFMADQSAYDLNTKITTINPVAVSGAYTLRYQGFFMKKGFSFSLNSIIGRVDITQSVGDMMFYGYEDPLIQLAQSIPFVRKNLPPMDKFAWFYERNGSNIFDGHFNMGTVGPQFGQMYNWNHWTHTPYYQKTCGDVGGSAGEFFPRNLPKGPLNIFNTEMCRVVVMDYDGEVTKSMMNGYKYTLGDHFLDNGTIIPENECYCTGDCVPYGVMNVSTCRYGSPGFVSLPHFYKADPYYNNLIDGLNPTERHNFYMIVEPTTGLPIEVAARLQLNLMVKSVSGISKLDDINDVFFPMIWFEQVVKIPTSFSLALLIVLWLKEICLIAGFLLILTGASIIFCITYKICNMNLCGEEKTKFIMREMEPLNKEKITITRQVPLQTH